MPEMLGAIFLALIRCVRSRRELVLENLALRQQLARWRRGSPGRGWPSMTVCSGSSCGDSGPIGDVFLSLCNLRPWLAGIAPASSCTGNGFRVPTPEPAGTYTEGAARTHLSHGSGEQHLGCAAYPRRAEDARVRNLRANGPALDAKGAQECRASETLGSLPEQPS